MQKKIEFGPQSPGRQVPHDFIEQVENLFRSFATQRMGLNAPYDVQEGELWWRLDYPSSGQRTLMVRSGGQDAPFMQFATTAEAQDGSDDTKIMTPLKVRQAIGTGDGSAASGTAESIKDQRDLGSRKIWTGTESQYIALSNKDDNTIYFTYMS